MTIRRQIQTLRGAAGAAAALIVAVLVVVLVAATRQGPGSATITGTSAGSGVPSTGSPAITTAASSQNSTAEGQDAGVAAGVTTSMASPPGAGNRQAPTPRATGSGAASKSPSDRGTPPPTAPAAGDCFPTQISAPGSAACAGYFTMQPSPGP
jgi:hypothetical protein